MVTLQMPDNGRQWKKKIKKKNKKGFVFNFMGHCPSNIYYYLTKLSPTLLSFSDFRLLVWSSSGYLIA